MNYAHPGLANGKWQQLTLAQQIANIGSEVIRGFKWKTKGKKERSDEAFIRALELFDLTIEGKTSSQLKELRRYRSLIADYAFGANEFKLDREKTEKFFLQFNYLARSKK